MKDRFQNILKLRHWASGLALIFCSAQSWAAPSVSITVNGDPASGPYAVGATTNMTGSISIRFYVNDVLKKTEKFAPYCLTSEANQICQAGYLGAGENKVVAQVLDSSGKVIVQTTRKIFEGPTSCSFNGQTIASGSSIIAFQASSVPFGSSCLSENRICTNGVLSGSYPSAACTVQAPTVSAPVFLKANPQEVSTAMNATGLQLMGGQISISSINDSIGVYGNTTDDLVNFKRIPDPDDSTKKAFVFQVAQRDPGGSTGGKRTELSWHPTSFGHDIGGTYWSAIRVRIGSNVKNGPANDEVLVWQLQHNVPFVLNPNMVLVARGGGSNSKLFMTVKSNNNSYPTQANTSTRVVYSQVNYPADQWMTFVMQFKLHYADGHGAFLKVWKDGQLIVDDKLPNAYNGGQELDPARRNYQKIGIYHYYDQNWAPGDYRTVFHKGILTYKDDGKITEPIMRSLIQNR